MRGVIMYIMNFFVVFLVRVSRGHEPDDKVFCYANYIKPFPLFMFSSTDLAKFMQFWFSNSYKLFPRLIAFIILLPIENLKEKKSYNAEIFTGKIFPSYFYSLKIKPGKSGLYSVDPYKTVR